MFTMPARLFLYAHHDIDSDMHPMNVVDAQAKQFPSIADKFVLRAVTKEVSLGHVFMKKYPQLLKDKHADLTSKTEEYLLMSEAGCRTDWHQDYTGTAVRYEIVHGQKNFYMILPSPNNLTKFLAWKRLPEHIKRYVPNV